MLKSLELPPALMGALRGVGACPSPRKIIKSLVYAGASPGFGRWGAKNFCFQILEFACREAMRIVRGVRGHAPPEKFL